MEQRLGILRRDWHQPEFTRSMADVYLRHRAPGAFIVRRGPHDTSCVAATK